MLESLKISNYRSCTRTFLQLQPDLSVLIGPNGSGKTNILNAFLLLRALTREDDYFRTSGSGRFSLESEKTTNQCTLSASFRVFDKKLILYAKFNLHTDANNHDVVISSEQSWYAKDFTGSTKRIKFPIWLAAQFRSRARFESLYTEYSRHYRYVSDGNYDISDTVKAPLLEIWKFLTDIKYYSASQFTNPSLCPVSFEVEQEGLRRVRTRVRGVHDRFLYDIYEAQESDGYNQFLSVIGPDGIGLIDKIEFQEISTSSIDYNVMSGGAVRTQQQKKLLVIPQFVIGRNLLSPNQLSEGTFKTITLLFYLMTEESSALLIEEPEVCVHHGLLSSIIELIKSYSKHKQIIVSTHSDFVLDQIEPRHVYQVTKTESEGTSVRQIAKAMSSKELSALKRYLEYEGNLGEYWRHGGFG